VVFEGVGSAGVTTKGPNCVIQNCLSTSGTTKLIDGWSSSGTIVQNCETTRYPTFFDAEVAWTDAIATPANYVDPNSNTAPWYNFFQWTRKLVNSINYERANLNNMGSGCIARYNYVHDCMDAFSAYGSGGSTNLLVTQNFVQRLVDNACEYRANTVGQTFSWNVVEDSFEPVTYQPITAPPFASGCTIAHNVIYDTPAHLTYWKNLQTYGTQRSIFKWFIVGSICYPGGAPDFYNIPSGMIVQNNTFYQLFGSVFNWNMPTTVSGNSFIFGPVAFLNNCVISPYAVYQSYRETVQTPPQVNWSAMTFNNNVVGGPNPFSPTAGHLIAGSNGVILRDVSTANFTNIATNNFVPLPGSFLIGKGVTSFVNPSVPAPISLNSTAGAFDVGYTMPVPTFYGVQPGAL
jgi:hypothetical protein